MTQAGIILGILSAFGLVGSMVGGALTDRFGRRRLILFGLVFSAVSTLALGLVSTLASLYLLIVVIGLLSNVAGPAHDAMVADLLPENKRSEGFGILRVAGNLAWIIGPTIGGVVAARSFFMLFVIDSVLSGIVAYIFYKLIPETKPSAPAEKSHESVWQTVKGYRLVLRDFAYMAFLLASMIMLAVYQQMYNTLPVYLRDSHGFTPSAYGFFLTTSAITVVLFQFWVSRSIKNRPPFLMMALGTVFYAFGFGMIGFISAYLLFLLASIIITIGEMIMMPTSQALAANFAPVDMRGRYMAVFGLSWAIPSMFGPRCRRLDPRQSKPEPALVRWRTPVHCVCFELSGPAPAARYTTTFCQKNIGRTTCRIDRMSKLGRNPALESGFGVRLQSPTLESEVS